jgi:O-methyltransferase involved in polyketide biosynthesis
MVADRPRWAPPEVNLDHPSVARVYDFYLGGSHNFESDRAFAHQVMSALPEIRTLSRDNRAFLRRAVRYLCAEGIDQFLDLGSGIPTEGNVHEVARRTTPQARVVYVDHDPIAVVHSRHLLEDDDRTDAVLADVRDVERVLELATDAGLDLGRPVAVLAVAVLPFLDDTDRPADVMARYLAAVPSGSHVAITHFSNVGPPAFLEGAHVYDRADSPNAVRLRTPEGIAALFGEVEILSPGVVPTPRWRPDPSDDEAEIADDYPNYAGVGRKS